MHSTITRGDGLRGVTLRPNRQLAGRTGLELATGRQMRTTGKVEPASKLLATMSSTPRRNARTLDSSAQFRLELGR